MSRLARLTTAAAGPLVAPTADLAVIAGFMGGEFGSGVGFLRSYYVRGPAASSPLAFQNSVHNAPAAHLSIDLGLHGPSETLLGDIATGWRVIERAMCRVVSHGTAALVVVADDLCPEVRAGIELAGGAGVWGEAAGALLIGPMDHAGLALILHDGPAPPRAWGRAQQYPDEPQAPVPDFAWDTRFGLGPGAEFAALVGLARRGAGALAGPGLWLEVA